MAAPIALRSPASSPSPPPLLLRKFHPRSSLHLRIVSSAPHLSLRASRFHRSPRPAADLVFRFPLRCLPDDSGYLSTGTPGGEAEGHQEDQDVDVSVRKDTNATIKKTKDDASGDPANVSEAGQKDDYKQSAEKFVEVLRDTTEQLKEQAEKAKSILVVTAQETVAVITETAQGTAERSKENLSFIAENAPDPIKEIAETALKAHSAEAPKTFAKIHDFCLGIPYGAFLVMGGLIWFIISGSTAAIRFGVILGGILLALSVSSLKSWKEGKSSSFYIKGQAAISLIIMLREVRRFFEVKAFSTALIALVSAGMLGFYGYVFLAGGNPPPKKSKLPSEG